MRKKKYIELSYRECNLIRYYLNCYLHEMPRKNLKIALSDVNKKMSNYATVETNVLLCFDYSILLTIYRMLNIEYSFNRDLEYLVSRIYGVLNVI